MKGQIHSIESFGTVDGPGIRMVVFTKGCPMRCQYCHNPDTWAMDGGRAMTADEILDQYETSLSFYKNGGITVTGGEPLVQIDFVTELFEKAKSKKIHTCLDTSGILFDKTEPILVEKFDKLMAVTDLVLLDIKHIDPPQHEKLCGQPLAPVLHFAAYLDQKQIPVWIRHVVVPGITFDALSLYQLGRYIGTLSNVKALDVLPYHDMGKGKYEAMNLAYPLKGIPALSKEDAIKAKKVVLQGIRDERLGKPSKSDIIFEL